MKRMAGLELVVGLFLIAGLVSLLILAFKVSGFSSYSHNQSYVVEAAFDNVGDLKARAPVSIAGVRVGEVTDIHLDNETYRAVVSMRIDSHDKIPTDSSASILTQGLLGSNYIGLTPGFDDSYLKSGSKITDTHPALILEQLIGQMIFKFSKDKK